MVELKNIMNMNTNYFVLCAAALVMFAACQKEENATPKVSLTASLEQQIDNTTKTALGTENTVVWSEGDVIKVHGASGEEELTLSGGAGTTTGVFGATTVTNPDYAIYPASAYSSISSSTVTFTLPATQTYAENSFGPGANVAVAAISGNTMSFKNVCGVLKLQLKGSMKVSKIELTGKNDEKLCGSFTVNAAANPFVGAVKSGEPTDDEKKVTLDCSHFGETSEGAADGGVQLNAETATIFDIIVPVSAFAGGFEAKITDVSGETFYTTLATTKNNTIARSTVTKMPCKAVSLLPADYTELIYVKNSTGYIDTKVTIAEMNHSMARYSINVINSAYHYICGARGLGNKALGYDLYAATHGGATFYNRQWPEIGTPLTTNEIVETETIYQTLNSKFYVNRELLWSTTTWPNAPLTGSRTLYLFALNGDSPEYIANARIYYYRMLNDDNYIRYFIPAKVSNAGGVTDAKGQEAPEGTLGLYDLIENKFYTNDGIGSFTAGQELTD